jgi:GntR family transcriptional regulator/MocR family aminotransferase
MRAPDGVNTNFLSERLRLESVLIEPGAAFFAGPEKPTCYYRLAYSSIPTGRIRDGIALVARAIRQAQSRDWR